jgi:hypothetical protein
MKTGGCDKALKTLERVKGIEPSYSAWKPCPYPSRTITEVHFGA